MLLRAAWLLVYPLCVLPAIGAAADAIPLDACPTSRSVLNRAQPPTTPARSPGLGPTELRADSIRSLGPDEIELSGDAQAAHDGQRIHADLLRYRNDQDEADAVGNVVITENDGSQFTTGEAHLNLDTRVGAASAGSYRLFDRAGRGDMSRVEFLDRDHTRLFDVRYTACPEGRDDWFLQARQIDLDTSNDAGLARDATLRVFGVPVLYLPVFGFPISDRRKSGFLVPQIGYGSELGAVVAAPYYWNIAPNYDATLTPRWMTQRGLQLQSEFRYLGQSLNGRLEAEYLPNDKKTGEDRAAATFIHNQTFNPYWSAAVSLRGVSDKDYLSDFGDHLSVTSETYLPENMEANYRGSAWTFTARATDYQTVDRTIAPISLPYARLPQLLLNGDSGPTTGGLQYRLESEFVNFNRDIGVIGKRANLSPSVQLPLTRPYGFLTPTVGVHYIGYSLEQAPTPDSRASVTAPFASLDTGLYFDRTLELGSGGFDQTLEPRLYYLYVPARAQDSLPNFDTSVPDFSFANLFRNNRFIGGDRIGDANQYTAALTTRLIDQTTGTERLSASIGRIHYFDARTVNLPPGTIDDASSDVAAEAVVWLPGNWHARTSLQWAPERDQAVRQEFFLQYEPAADRIVNVGYHFVRDSLEQSDISAEWPLGPRWTLRGRSLYSLRDNENVDSFLGAEYRNCCWALRFYATRRLVQTPTGSAALTEQRTGVLLEFELSGLSGTRSSFESPLHQGLFTFPAAAASNP
jgi:LPS-assembly protein